MNEKTEKTLEQIRLKVEAVKKLEALQSVTDIEMAHVEADETLCDLLKSLGYEDVVKEFNKIYKWYA